MVCVPPPPGVAITLLRPPWWIWRNQGRNEGSGEVTTWRLGFFSRASSPLERNKSKRRLLQCFSLMQGKKVREGKTNSEEGGTEKKKDRKREAGPRWSCWLWKCAYDFHHQKYNEKWWGKRERAVQPEMKLLPFQTMVIVQLGGWLRRYLRCGGPLLKSHKERRDDPRRRFARANESSNPFDGPFVLLSFWGGGNGPLHVTSFYIR